MVRFHHPALGPPLKPVNGSATHTLLFFRRQDSEIAFFFLSPFFSGEMKMQANKPESCLLSAQNNPGSHEKTIPICGKPRRHEGFGIHCRILCIIKTPPPQPPSRTPSPAYQSAFQATKQLTQWLLVSVPRPCQTRTGLTITLRWGPEKRDSARLPSFPYFRLAH